MIKRTSKMEMRETQAWYEYAINEKTAPTEPEGFENWLLGFIEAYGNVTFGEIMNRMEDGGKGDWSMHIPDREDLIVWAGANELLINTVNKLLVEERIHCKPTSWLTCLYDGHVLKLPIAKKPPKKGYKKPHWVPVVLKLGPA